MIKEVTIYPAHEFVLEKSIQDICEKISNKYNDDIYEQTVKTDIELIKTGNYISKIDKYYDIFYDTTTNIISCFY